MTLKHKTRMLSLLLVVVGMLLACGLAGGDPTPTSAPPPTDVPVQATTVSEPTQAPEPTQAAEPTQAPAPTTDSSQGSSAPIEIVMVNGYLDSFDSWNIIGLVRNNTDRILDNIEIEIEIFDASNVSLFKDTTYADLYNIAPGEITPFSYIVFEDLPSADNYVATVVGNSTTELERAFPDVANTRITHDDDGDTHLTGELINNSDRPMVINSLAGATFNGIGEVLTADSYTVSVRYLDPGESGPFRISISGADTGTSDISTFQIYVDAQFDDAVAPFGLTISDAYNYTDAFDNLHLVGEVTNAGSQTLNINLIAGIYDANGIVLDAADISLAVSALAPGETVPYDFDFWGPLNYTSGLLDEADSYTIQVDPYWTWDTSTETVALTTQNDVKEFDEYGGQFDGQVVNNSGGAVDSVTVIVYLRDLASNQVVAMGYDYIFDEIADGGTADYTVYIDVPSDFDINSAAYNVIVIGERP